MILGIVSETHDNLNRIPDGVALLCEHSPDLIVHAGDFISPFTAKCFEPVRERGIPFLGIFGNNDGERFFLRQTYDHIGPIHEDPHVFSLGDRRILVTHKELLVDALAASGRYDVVIYGHTHKVLSGPTRVSSSIPAKEAVGGLADAPLRSSTWSRSRHRSSNSDRTSGRAFGRRADNARYALPWATCRADALKSYRRRDNL